jgi:hypothetical protein
MVLIHPKKKEEKISTALDKGNFKKVSDPQKNQMQPGFSIQCR